MNWLVTSNISAKSCDKETTSPNLNEATQVIRTHKPRKIVYWSLEDDEKLGNLVNETNFNWVEISKSFNNRTLEEIKNRWAQRFDPNVKKVPWTLEEDNLLKKMHLKFGANWKTISKYMPGRLPNAIKNRFYSAIHKKKETVQSFVVVDPIPDETSDDLLLDSFFSISDEKLGKTDITLQTKEQRAEKNGKFLSAEDTKSQKLQELYGQIASLEKMLQQTKESLQKYSHISKNKHPSIY